MPTSKLPLPDTTANLGFQLQYEHRNGCLFQGDSLPWLGAIPSSTVDLIFADPPYNINKADWDTFESQKVYVEWAVRWIRECSRILKDSGSMYISGFSEILADVKHPACQFFKGCKWLVWYYTNKANLGLDWGRSHESILHLRKSKTFRLNVDQVRVPYMAHTLRYPARPQAETSQYGSGKSRADWTPHPLGAKPRDVLELPTISNGMEEKTPHPTQKPEALLRKLILASSGEGDIVLDPFSGSGTTLVAAQQLGRRWLGCDLSAQYNEWAAKRIASTQVKSIQDWIEVDRQNLRRAGVRQGRLSAQQSEESKDIVDLLSDAGMLVI